VIYFIQAEESKRIKIGYTNETAYSARKNVAKRRLNVLQVGSPEVLDLLSSIDGTQEDEQELHAQFAPYRIHGEWFRCEGCLKDFVAQLQAVQR
jgi:hypothetical protein